MKHIVSFVFILVSIFCRAQDSIVKIKIDSLNKVTRVKADLVLDNFGSIQTNKLLYSISDEHYYILFKDSCCYREYYIQLDSNGRVIKKRVIKSGKRSKKLFVKAFDFNQYNKDFTTKVDNPEIVQGNNSYFVVKDSLGNKYGEFALTVLTKPIPIAPQLYTYLLTTLLRESTKTNKAP